MWRRLLLVVLTLLPLVCWGEASSSADTDVNAIAQRGGGGGGGRRGGGGGGGRRGGGGSVRVRVRTGPRRGGRGQGRVYPRRYYNRPRYRVRRYYVPGPVVVSPRVVAPPAMPINRVQVALVSETPTIREDESFYVGLYFHIPEGTEIYWREEDEQFGPPVEWELPDGFEIEDLSSRTAITEERDGQQVGYFRESIMLMAKISAPDDLEVGETVEIGAEVRFFACEQGRCRSVKFEPEIQLSVVD